jgi:hypothetical protein
MKLIESKAEILNTRTIDELKNVVESFVDAGRYRFNYDLDYADNAIIAEMNLQYGMAELLRLAAKRERTLL